MNTKTIIAAAAIAVTAALGTASVAQADPHGGVSIGFGFGNFGPSFGSSICTGLGVCAEPWVTLLARSTIPANSPRIAAVLVIPDLLA